MTTLPLPTAAPRLTKADMPKRGTKSAPETFEGDYKELKTFLQEYDLMADKYNVPQDERCENVCRYMDRKQRELVEATPWFTKKDWAQLKLTLEFLYDVEKGERLYSEGDLASLVRRTHRSKSISSLHAWRKHARKFLRVAGFLENHQKITEAEQNKYFWRSLPKQTRVGIESAILHLDPTIDVSKPFSWTMMHKAAELLFNPNRFYDDGLFESSDSDSEDEEPISQSKNSDSDSDSEVERPRKKRKRTKAKPQLPKRKKERRGRESELEPMDVDPPNDQSTYDSVEDLIRRMGKLDISDPDYTLLYYKAVRADPSVASFITKPGPRVAKNQPAAGAGRPSQTTSAGPGTRASMTCFACGQTGHGANNCPEAEKLVESGVVKKDDKGFLVWLNGDRIRRNPNENILEAINRQLAEHGVGEVGYIGSVSGIEEISDTFPAEMEPLRPKRKVFDGVHMPPRPSKSPHLTQDHPEDILPMFDPANDDVIMEDDHDGSGRSKKDKAARGAAKDDGNVKSQPAQSELQKRVDATALTEKLLKASVTMEVGDILGLAPFIGKRVADMLRVQRPSKPVATVASAVAPLIYIPITIDGVKFDAIVDTGSQLDLMSREIFEKLRIPINRAKKMFMNGVTGHRTLLDGLCENTTVRCGGVETVSDLWVGGPLPFALLLGRPWMTANYVSVEQRSDGTWIVFKETEHPHAHRGEINVAPESRHYEWQHSHQFHDEPVMSATVGICEFGPVNNRPPPSQIDYQRMHWIYFCFTVLTMFANLVVHILMLQSAPQWRPGDLMAIQVAVDSVHHLQDVLINIPPVGIGPLYLNMLLLMLLGLVYVLQKELDKRRVWGENHPLRKRRYGGRDDDDLEGGGLYRGKGRRFRY
jgi:hypothetical protein